MLKNQRIFVTGGSGGLGRAIARACAGYGARVGIGYCSSAAGAMELAQSIVDNGGEALAVRVDVTDVASIEQALAQFVDAYGGVDGWVNCAGVVKPGLLVSSEEDDLREQLIVNLLGPLLCCRAVLTRMMRQRRGIVLNIGSVAAQRPSRGQAAYAASKGGLEALTRALAVEYARKGIRTVCLQVGAVDTNMLAPSKVLANDEILARIPQRRIASAAEVAEHAAFLLSDRAAYTTGSCHTVDGGYLVG